MRWRWNRRLYRVPFPTPDGPETTRGRRSGGAAVDVQSVALVAISSAKKKHRARGGIRDVRVAILLKERIVVVRIIRAASEAEREDNVVRQWGMEDKLTTSKCKNSRGS